MYVKYGELAQMGLLFIKIYSMEWWRLYVLIKFSGQIVTT